MNVSAFNEVPKRFLVAFSVVLIVPVVISVYVASVYLATVSGNLDASGNAVGRDFVLMWVGGKLAASDDIATVFDPPLFYATVREIFGPEFPFIKWVYPPHFLFIALPLAYLSYLGAYAAWCGITLISFLAAARWAGLHWLGVGVLFAAPSTFINGLTGQNGFLTAALCIAGWALLKERPWLAGIMFGALTIKPHLGILIPIALIAAREWRAMAGAAITFGVFVATSTALFGADAWSMYINVIGPDMADYVVSDKGVAEWMMPTFFNAAGRLGFDSLTAGLVQFPATVLAAVITYQAFRRPWPFEFKISTFMACVFLATPYAFNYDMAYLSIPVIVLLGHAASNNLRQDELWTAAAAWLLPMAIFPLNYHHLPLSPLIILALVACLWRRAEIAAANGKRVFAKF